MIHHVLWMHHRGARCTEALHEPQSSNDVHCCAEQCCNALKFEMHRCTAKMHRCTAATRTGTVPPCSCRMYGSLNANWSSLARGLHCFHRFTTLYRDAKECNAVQGIKQPCPKGCCYILYYTIFPLVTVHHMSNVGLP